MSGFSINLFGSKRPEAAESKDVAKEWKRKLATEARSIDRDITHLKREEDKAIKELKKLAKSGHTNAMKTLARQVVMTRKSVERMHTAKAQLNSVAMQLKTTASLVKMQGCMAKSTEVMQAMNRLINIPELSAAMREMAREMERSGLIEEVIDDAMGALDSADMDTEIENEVNSVVAQLTAEALAPAKEAPRTKLPSSPSPATSTSVSSSISMGGGGGGGGEGGEEEMDEGLREMQARLQSL